MKRLLFLLPSFQLGGTNSALNNFLSKIDKERFAIDVFAFDDKGPNRKIVEKYAHILGGGDTGDAPASRSRYSIKDLVRGIKRLLFKLHIDISPLAFRRVAKQLSANNYDIVIAFQEGQTTRFLTYFKDVYKVAWIHCDYREHIEINGIEPEHNIYALIDKIVCVSAFTRKSFLSVVPEVESKTVYLHNAMDVDSILKRSKEDVAQDMQRIEGVFNLVSIGRFDPVKRFDFIPEIASKLKSQDCRFKWYIIGSGAEDYWDEVNKCIKDYSVEEEVICLGAKPNPYPYIVKSDIVVITSVSEACPIVLNEGKVLQVPVVTTDYGSSYEFIEDGKNGMICTIEEMPAALGRLMKDDNLYKTIKDNLSHFEYPNKRILDQLENEIFVK